MDGLESDHHMIISYSDAAPEADKASWGGGVGGEDSVNESPQFTGTESTSHHLVK